MEGVAAWTHGITVWRNNSYTPVFDTGYQYTFSANNTQSNPMVIDAGTSPVQQWSKSAGLASSMFKMAASGSTWTISTVSSAKCLDAGAGANGTALVFAACNGKAQQSFAITPDIQTGSFFLKAASTGRCINVRGGSTAAGAVMEVDDCNSNSSGQKFAIQAS